MKRLLLVFFILLISGSTFAEGHLGKHHIFFVHGLAGTEDTFGHMPDRLVEHLDKKDPIFKHQSYIFSYPTENNNLDAYDFSMMLSKFVKKQTPNLGAADRISFVAHSQGGLITSIFLFSSHANREGYLSEYKENFDAFVTLGTPFWGSKLADVITHPQSAIDRIIGYFKKDYFNRAGDKQLEEMSLFSRTIRRFRQHISEMDQTMVYDIFGKMRILNIGGIANLQKLSRMYDTKLGKLDGLGNVLPFVFGGDYEYESDIAVSLPSSRFDSIYINDVVKGYRPGRLTGEDQTFETELVKFVPVYGVHASPKPDEFLDIAYLPEQMCITPKGCKHPTYELVFRHFNNLELDGSHYEPVDERRLNGFVVSFNVQFPEDHSYIKDQIEVSLVEHKDESRYFNNGFNGVELEFNKFWEKRSFSVVPGDKGTGFHFTGAFHYPEEDSVLIKRLNKSRQIHIAKEGARLLFKIKARGFKRRYVYVRVKPVKSTFVNINLEPYKKY